MEKKINISKMDCEERFGFASAGMFAAGKFSSFIPGVIFTAIFYAVLFLLRIILLENSFIEMFFPGGAEERTWIPAITVFMAAWCWSMLLMKRSKLRVQYKVLKAVPEKASVPELEEFLDSEVESVNDFAASAVLKKYLQLREQQTPENEKLELLDNTIADLEKSAEVSFIPVSGLIWAIPVLGFIGTVLGLARAVANFGSLLEPGTGGSSFAELLPQVTGGLATAFETTLIALALALILQLFSCSQSYAEAGFFARLKQKITDLESAGQ